MSRIVGVKLPTLKLKMLLGPLGWKTKSQLESQLGLPSVLEMGRSENTVVSSDDSHPGGGPGIVPAGRRPDATMPGAAKNQMAGR